MIPSSPLLFSPSVAVAIHVCDRRTFCQSIQNCDGQRLILEYLVPFEKVKVRGDNRASRLASQG